MAERVVRVKANLKVETDVVLVLYDDDTVEELLPRCFEGGLKQYMKDYDFRMGYESPVDVLDIVSVEDVE